MAWAEFSARRADVGTFAYRHFGSSKNLVIYTESASYIGFIDGNGLHMPHQQYISTSKLTALAGALLCVVLVAVTLVTAAAWSPAADAQANIERLVVWDRTQADSLLDDSKVWQFSQSTSAQNDIGSATAADPAFDDSSWDDVNLRWEALPGPGVANHFRKEFSLEEIGVDLFQIQGIQVGLQYDDTAVLYLNGVEVYRSIRGNLDRDYSEYPLGTDIPFDALIEYGGAENFYVQIPDLNEVNAGAGVPGDLGGCEANPGCTRSPFGGPQPPAIPVDLLNANGTNTWAITTWNQSGGGSGDSTLNHTFELLIDTEAIEPVFINEVMASNDFAYGVQLDDDPQLEFPDWFELYNSSAGPVNLEGWTINDDSDAPAWVFPAITMEAGEYLVVVANDDDRDDTPILQTNFKISAGGDSLRLVNPAGFVADEYLLFPQQVTDVSYGRPRDTGNLNYLETPTPGEQNSRRGEDFTPILRLFANRMYNPGESVRHQVNAFDPDGDPLNYSLNPLPPGLSVDSTGLITGTLDEPGTHVSRLTVTDSDGRSDFKDVTWIVQPSVAGPVPLVLNEYNAVPGDEEFRSGGPEGNGGDWFEFIVLEDGLDLRGYTIELFDRKGGVDEDELRLASTVTFADDLRLAHAPAGTIITISQDLADDLDFDPDNGDWHINFQVTAAATGTYFDASFNGAVFNSTRSGQTVLIRNAQGEVVTPLSGETDAWDSVNGNVSSSEVMNLSLIHI